MLNTVRIPSVGRDIRLGSPLVAGRILDHSLDRNHLAHTSLYHAGEGLSLPAHLDSCQAGWYV